MSSRSLELGQVFLGLERYKLTATTDDQSVRTVTGAQSDEGRTRVRTVESEVHYLCPESWYASPDPVSTPTPPDLFGEYLRFVEREFIGHHIFSFSRILSLQYWGRLGNEGKGCRRRINK